MFYLKQITLLCLIAYNFAVYSTAATVQNARIIGGSTIDISSTPYLVSLRYKKNATTSFEHRCAGTIYAASIILTTATCVIGLKTQQIHIVAGTSYRSHQDGYIFPAQQLVLHPDFNIWLYENDLAIVKLADDLPLGKSKIIAKISLATSLPIAGAVSSIAGWGATSELNLHTEYLQLAMVEIVSYESCRQSYGQNRITSAMLCAGIAAANGYIDACIGDAGGPLVVHDKLVGLISWGSGCGRKDFPGVYTNLVYFRQWIENEVSQL